MVKELKSCKWYLYNGERIFVQKLLGEFHYWDSDGWHPLSEMVRNILEESKEQ